MTSTPPTTPEALRAISPTPISSLNPSLDTGGASISGVITIVWPYSILHHHKAFLLAHPDARLRRENGIVKVQLEGPPAKKFEELKLAAGDELVVSLHGARLDERPVATAMPGVIAHQILLGPTAIFLVNATDERSEQFVCLDTPPDEPAPPPFELPIPLPTDYELRLPIMSTPGRPAFGVYAPSASASAVEEDSRSHSPENPSIKRTRDNLEEFESPAFLKRARVSYGALFEGGLDLWDEEDAILEKATKKNRAKRRRSNFNRLSTGWRLQSRSVSPVSEKGEEEDQAEDEEEASDSKENSHDPEEVRSTVEDPGPVESKPMQEDSAMDDGPLTVYRDPEPTSDQDSSRHPETMTAGESAPIPTTTLQSEITTTTSEASNRFSTSAPISDFQSSLISAGPIDGLPASILPSTNLNMLADAAQEAMGSVEDVPVSISMFSDCQIPTDTFPNTSQPFIDPAMAGLSADMLPTAPVDLSQYSTYLDPSVSTNSFTSFASNATVPADGEAAQWGGLQSTYPDPSGAEFTEMLNRQTGFGTEGSLFAPGTEIPHQTVIQSHPHPVEHVDISSDEEEETQPNSERGDHKDQPRDISRGDVTIGSRVAESDYDVEFEEDVPSPEEEEDAQAEIQSAVSGEDEDVSGEDYDMRNHADDQDDKEGPGSEVEEQEDEEDEVDEGKLAGRVDSNKDEGDENEPPTITRLQPVSPVVIDLLSDSDDDDEPAPAPATSSAKSGLSMFQAPTNNDDDDNEEEEEEEEDASSGSEVEEVQPDEDAEAESEVDEDQESDSDVASRSEVRDESEVEADEVENIRQFPDDDESELMDDENTTIDQDVEKEAEAKTKEQEEDEVAREPEVHVIDDDSNKESETEPQEPSPRAPDDVALPPSDLESTPARSSPVREVFESSPVKEITVDKPEQQTETKAPKSPIKDIAEPESVPEPPSSLFVDEADAPAQPKAANTSEPEKAVDKTPEASASESQLASVEDAETAVPAPEQTVASDSKAIPETLTPKSPAAKLPVPEPSAEAPVGSQSVSVLAESAPIPTTQSEQPQPETATTEISVPATSHLDVIVASSPLRMVVEEPDSRPNMQEEAVVVDAPNPEASLEVLANSPMRISPVPVSPQPVLYDDMEIVDKPQESTEPRALREDDIKSIASVATDQEVEMQLQDDFEMSQVYQSDDRMDEDGDANMDEELRSDEVVIINPEDIMADSDVEITGLSPAHVQDVQMHMSDDHHMGVVTDGDIDMESNHGDHDREHTMTVVPLEFSHQDEEMGEGSTPMPEYGIGTQSMTDVQASYDMIVEQPITISVSMGIPPSQVEALVEEAISASQVTIEMEPEQRGQEEVPVTTTLVIVEAVQDEDLADCHEQPIIEEVKSPEHSQEPPPVVQGSSHVEERVETTVQKVGTSWSQDLSMMLATGQVTVEAPVKDPETTKQAEQDPSFSLAMGQSGEFQVEEVTETAKIMVQAELVEDPSVSLARGESEFPQETSQTATTKDPSVAMAHGESLHPKESVQKTPSTPKATSSPVTTRTTRSQSRNLSQPPVEEDMSAQLVRESNEPPKTRAVARRQGSAAHVTDEDAKTSQVHEEKPQEASESSAGLLSLDDLTLPQLKALITKSLKDLKHLSQIRSVKTMVNKTIDVLALVALTPAAPKRPSRGRRDFFLNLVITDVHSFPLQVVAVTISHAHKDSLPSVFAGDMILLRKFHVASLTGKGFGLQSAEESSWGVWPGNGGELQVRGGDVDVTKEEERLARESLVWGARMRRDGKQWGMLEKKAKVAA